MYPANGFQGCVGGLGGVGRSRAARPRLALSDFRDRDDRSLALDSGSGPPLRFNPKNSQKRHDVLTPPPPPRAPLCGAMRTRPPLPLLALGVATAACVLLAGWTSWMRRRRRRKELPKDPPAAEGGAQSAPTKEPLLREVDGEVAQEAGVEFQAGDEDDEDVEEVLSRAELARRRERAQARKQSA